jgi:uncharacterized protein YdhG (YjbR/CyaY superfamily)
MKRKPGSVDDYLASLSDDKRRALTKLRKAIRAAIPKAEECISYQLPAFRYRGKVLVWFGAAAHHCSFYPGSFPIEAHKRELAAYDISKGTIRFPAEKPLPAAPVRKLVMTRVAEYAPRPRVERLKSRPAARQS